MIELDEVRILAEKVELELFLEGKQRKKMVETVHLAASEYKLVVFEQVVSMFIYIDLQGRIEGMYCKFIVV